MPRVTTIDKCFDILEALLHAKPEGMGVRALARQLETNVTSTHNMCRTLCDRGYLWQDPGSKRFQLGIGMTQFARSEHVWQRLSNAAEPLVRECQRRLDESILLATVNAHEMITLNYIPSSQALRVHEPHTMGDRAYGTAVGKVLLSGLERDELRQYLRHFPPRAFTKSTLVKEADIEHELNQIRTTGYGQTRDELTLGVSAVAVPITGPHNKLFAAIGASAPTVRLNEEGFQSTLNALTKVAKTIRSAWFD